MNNVIKILEEIKLNKEEIEKLIENTTKTIIHHNNLYYNENNPEISDYEYDMLLRKLMDLEKKFPEFKNKNSPTTKIGEKASSSFNKVKHKVYMGSLQNAYSFDELIKFEQRLKEKINDISYVVEPKIDGLSVSLEYENSKFVRGSTRGDGFEGEDVTENLKTIKNIPKTLNEKIEFLEVRAEVYMPVQEFNKLTLNQQKNGEVTFKNPRNAAAGSLRQKNAFITSTRNLKAICFNIQQIRNYKLTTHNQAIELLRNLGFFTIPESKIYKTIKDCQDKLEEIKNQKEYYDFEIDGAVIKINSLKNREILGSTSKNPRWAIAFKYPPEEKETFLKKIEIKIGRTGILTPVAMFDSINLSKTTINKASLHNQNFIDKNDIRIGDLVLIRKAGEIIPEVVMSVKHKKNSEPYKMPKICPACKMKVIKVKSFLQCVNPSCPATILQNIVHFVSKNAMNISGLGEKTIKTLLEKKLIKDVSDLYVLKKEDILNIENFKEKSTQNLLDAIEQSKKNPTWRLLFALGIREVGQKTAKILFDKYSSILEIMNAKKEDLIEIKEIGEIVASNITKYFSSEQTKNLIEKLNKYGVNLNSEQKTKKENLKLHNICFAITGKFENLSRKKLEDIIEQNGGKTTNNISVKTNYLISGDKPGSKLEKAKNLNIKIINKNEFLNLINN